MSSAGPGERRIALFIDFENLVTNTGISAAAFDLQPTLDRLLEKGKILFRRAYCDWSRFHEAKVTLHQLGVELIEVPPSTRAGKNGADMRLVIDALELCYAREHIDTYVIASGDSDFVPLAAKLRENDRFVIGLGVKQSTSPLFIKACDEFMYLDRRERERTDDSARRARPEGGPARPRQRAQVPPLVRQVVSSLLARATGPLNPSSIKEALVRKNPAFDERDIGFSSFSRLLEALEREGLLTRIQQGRQTYVTAKEGAPEVQPDEPARAEPAEPPEGDEVDEEEAIPDPEEP